MRPRYTDPMTLGEMLHALTRRGLAAALGLALLARSGFG